MRTIWINFLWNTPRVKKFKKNCFLLIWFCSFCWNENVWKIEVFCWTQTSQVPSFPIHRPEMMMVKPQEGEGNGLILGGRQREYLLDHFQGVFKLGFIPEFRFCEHIWPVTVWYSVVITSTGSTPVFLNLFFIIFFLRRVSDNWNFIATNTLYTCLCAAYVSVLHKLKRRIFLYPLDPNFVLLRAILPVLRMCILEQWFSSRGHFNPPGEIGNAWRHFWLSQLEGRMVEVVLLAARGRGQVCR